MVGGEGGREQPRGVLRTFSNFSWRMFGEGVDSWLAGDDSPYESALHLCQKGLIFVGHHDKYILNYRLL